MGIGDLVNSGLGKVGEVVDQGKKLTGELVDKGTDVAGDALDKVGAHDLADKVENAGDRIASDLGATPGERQLGQSDQPKDLVHGDAKAIRATAKHLTDFYTAFDKVGDGMRRLNSSSWQGEAAEAFRKKFAMHPTKWLQAADACDAAGKALSSYAETVEWAQGQAQDAIDLYGPGKRASDAYKADVAKHKDDDKQQEPTTDPGAAAVQRAHEILNEARRQRDEAGRTAASAVRKALAHAPAEPPPLARLKADAVDGFQAVNTEILHFDAGVFKGTAGILNFARGLNPMDPYNITHPAAYVQNVNMTLAGLVSTAAHPERAAKTMLDDFMKDPSEGTGRLLPNLFGDGAGLEAAFGRAALKEGMESAVESGVQRSARDAAGDAAGAGRKGATENPEGVSRRPEETVCERDPIDVATGHMVLPQTDLSLPGALPLVLKRSFNSAYRSGRWFGPTWSSTVDQRLEIDAEGVVLIAEDGLLLTYPHPAPGLPTLPAHGPRWPLHRVEGGYTITDPDSGRVRHFADSGADLALLEQLDDRNGNWITFEYDAEGTPLGIAHSGGHELRFTTAHGRITALHLTTDAARDGSAQEILRYGYTDGHLTEVTNSSGIPLHFACDEHGRITSWTDTNGSRFDYVYDDRDRCTHQSGAAGHLNSTFAYDTTDPETGDSVTAITNSLGHTARYLVNDRAQVTAEIDETGSVTRYRRDRHNRLLSRTDPLGRTTAFRYDETGNLLTVTRPDGRESRAEYNELGLPVRLVDPDGTVIHQTYDERGNRTSVTDPTGHTTHFAYDDTDHLTSVTDPLGQATTVHCDRTGLPLEITDPLGGVTRYDRDSFGRTVTLTDALGATTRWEWTVRGRCRGGRGLRVRGRRRLRVRLRVDVGVVELVVVELLPVVGDVLERVVAVEDVLEVVLQALADVRQHTVEQAGERAEDAVLDDLRPVEAVRAAALGRAQHHGQPYREGRERLFDRLRDAGHQVRLLHQPFQQRENGDPAAGLRHRGLAGGGPPGEGGQHRDDEQLDEQPHQFGDDLPLRLHDVHGGLGAGLSDAVELVGEVLQVVDAAAVEEHVHRPHIVVPDLRRQRAPHPTGGLLDQVREVTHAPAQPLVRLAVGECHVLVGLEELLADEHEQEVVQLGRRVDGHQGRSAASVLSAVRTTVGVARVDAGVVDGVEHAVLRAQHALEVGEGAVADADDRLGEGRAGRDGALPLLLLLRPHLLGVAVVVSRPAGGGRHVRDELVDHLIGQPADLLDLPGAGDERGRGGGVGVRSHRLLSPPGLR